MSDLNKILYVEDEEDIQMIAQVALEDIGGYTVQICSTGKEAINKAPDFNPDLILLDVMMPDMDGITTLQELRKIGEFSNTPAMFMTAKIQPHEVQQLKELGALDIIAKPFDPMTLSEQIQASWDKQ